ncbi:sensor histidine kinase YesM [Aquimarina sp. EL_43]|uniref:sensor histidine kinase n=1 Tax=Aquimarina TaxID=290174 RepID=UPI0004BA9611|nr:MULTISPECIES: histidine kinase [Aquimarina]MBG6132338.1 sensor histidine kinase YesM [Aquimarina sp. EL_35]MBG6152469.1 sensor histidine kinase YesM [Aquimarina sp. EL_32]MBG6170604.1 sensor histidine kinase YesM [Aquimarina sp. EL_43]
MKSNRIYFYLLIILLLNALHLISEIYTDGLEEGIIETLILLPVSFLFTLFVFWSRLYIKNTIANKIITGKNKIHFLSFWAIVITIKTLVLTFVLKGFSTYFFNDDEDPEPFFDLAFWAVLLACFSIIVFVYFIEIFLESQKEKQDIKVKLTQYQSEKSIAQYLALKKQLNPHFLFNSFNSLLGLISIDSKKAEYFLQELSNIYRYNLTQSEEVVVTLRKELKLIYSYMSLQKIRFGEHITLEDHIEEAKLNFLLPPMTLELLLENAIKHNIIESNKPLKISIISEGNSIKVMNNFQPKNHHYEKSLGIGLKNLINQYKMLHPEIPHFKIINGNYIAYIPLIEPEL